MVDDKESENISGEDIEGAVVFNWTEDMLKEFKQQNKKVMEQLHDAMVDGRCCPMAYLPK